MAKPDDFYRLYGLKQQATRGDCNEERPMVGAAGCWLGLHTVWRAAMCLHTRFLSERSERGLHTRFLSERSDRLGPPT